MNNGKSFLTLAQSLGTQQSNKAALRSAISRAYYGAYNYARHTLRLLGFSRIADDDRNHGPVCWYFENCGDADAREAGQKLANLGGARIHADYHLDNKTAESPNNVQFNLMVAQSIISEFDSCISSPQKKAAVKQGMQNYEQVLRHGPATS